MVEDEAHLLLGLRINFELEGFAVSTACGAREALHLLTQPRPFDLIVLDVMLPDLSGITLCRRLRDAGDLTPILMLTARGSTDDRALGLNAGADDYLAKPFALEELLARVRSLLRRRVWERTSRHTATRVRVGAAEVDFQTFKIFVADKTFRLTPLEMALLRYFLMRPGRVIGREELLHEVWGLTHTASTRTIDNFVMRLRRYLNPEEPQQTLLVSVRGLGYQYLGSGLL